jgi:hypothetical protein
MEINQRSKSLPNCEWCHAAAKRPDNEFRGANLERRSIQRIERLGVGVIDGAARDTRPPRTRSPAFPRSSGVRLPAG